MFISGNYTQLLYLYKKDTVAVPGFLVGWGANLILGRQLLIRVHFEKFVCKTKESGCAPWTRHWNMPTSNVELKRCAYYKCKICHVFLTVPFQSFEPPRTAENYGYDQESDGYQNQTFGILEVNTNWRSTHTHTHTHTFHMLLSDKYQKPHVLVAKLFTIFTRTCSGSYAISWLECRQTNVWCQNCNTLLNVQYNKVHSTTVLLCEIHVDPLMGTAQVKYTEGCMCNTL